jgi:hypothetical protein
VQIVSDLVDCETFDTERGEMDIRPGFVDEARCLDFPEILSVEIRSDSLKCKSSVLENIAQISRGFHCRSSVVCLGPVYDSELLDLESLAGPLAPEA